jgi:branched-chain amino acid transport system substrate-binding protein
LTDQAQKDNVILIDTLDCDDEIAALQENIFCVSKKTEDLAITGALYAVKRKDGPAAILYFDGDPFMPKVAKITRETLVKNGLNVAIYEGGSSNTVDFRSLLVRAKQKHVSSIFFYGYDDFGLGMKQARELGIKANFYGLGVVKSPGFKASAGASLSGTYIAGWFPPESERYTSFLSQYVSKMGREPFLEVVTIPTYDMAKVLVNGFSRVAESGEKEYSTDKLRDYLYSVKDYQGLSGNIAIDADGTSRSFAVKEYVFSNGKFTEAD